jgi:hypothetical protein
VTRPEEDEAWRAIVENYGERPVLDDPAPESSTADEHTDRDDGRDADADLASSATGPRLPGPEPAPDEWEDHRDRAAYEITDRFHPPEPPPIPLPGPVRLAAWSGLFGAPALLLICLVLGIRLPSAAALALVVWFAGGFGYLVWHMPKGPSDPWDNVARV